jgi:rhamnosyl/mannosyltransferase
MTLRVLHVGKFYPPARGGMEKVLQVLAEGERGRGIDARVLVANGGRETIHEMVNGVPVTRVGTMKQVGAVSVCPALPLWMRRIDADVMVVHEPNPAAIVAHALARPSTPLVFWVHAEVVRPAWRYKAFYRPFLRRMLTRADRIVVASPRVAEFASELQPYRGKCVVIPYGLDPDQHAVRPGSVASGFRVRGMPEHASPSENRTNDDGPLVLFVGRLVPYKGVDVLLRALASVRVNAVIVGDGPLRSGLEQRAQDLGIAERVRFAGNASLDELTMLYNACDLFVLPSVTRAEAFGMVQVEAMSCRKPVVSTDLPSGVPWVNQHGVTGLVVPPGDAGALAAAIQTLIDDPELRVRMGVAGRQRVQREFSIARMVDQTTSLYASVCRRADATSPAVTRGVDLQVGRR